MHEINVIISNVIYHGLILLSCNQLPHFSPKFFKSALRQIKTFKKSSRLISSSIFLYLYSLLEVQITLEKFNFNTIFNKS